MCILYVILIFVLSLGGVVGNVLDDDSVVFDGNGDVVDGTDGVV